MSVISMTQARAHLRDPDDDDDYLQLLIDSAEQSAMSYLNRQVYADTQSMAEAVAIGAAGDNPMLSNAPFKSACLLILGHLYANREDVVGGISVAELPRGSQSLLTPYRVGWGI
ncbi:head-tail connector protein [Pseudomonas phoenicis]|uniref:head-tail connector protein n=1 Tax=unclassified Pseudomonas TaxID=196821 RepID=UPI00399F596B